MTNLKEVIEKTDYREILRLSSLGLNRTQIADSLGASRTTVIHALQRAAAQGLDWQAAETLGDRALTAKLFPNGSDTPNYQAPDYAYIHREMAKPGMTQQLLWMEYCDDCKASGTIPYQLYPLAQTFATLARSFWRDTASAPPSILL